VKKGNDAAQLLGKKKGAPFFRKGGSSMPDEKGSQGGQADAQDPLASPIEGRSYLSKGLGRRKKPAAT